MDTLLNCELVETARQLIRHNDETLSRQLEEFQEALSEILFSQMGYLEIDRKLRESAFIINERLMSKKKTRKSWPISGRRMKAFLWQFRTMTSV